jgi:hypothetical protein
MTSVSIGLFILKSCDNSVVWHVNSWGTPHSAPTSLNMSCFPIFPCTLLERGTLFSNISTSDIWSHCDVTGINLYLLISIYFPVVTSVCFLCG